VFLPVKQTNSRASLQQSGQTNQLSKINNPIQTINQKTMKKYLFISILLVIFGAFSGCKNLTGKASVKSSDLKTFEDSLSYVFGNSVGTQAKSFDVKINRELLVKGINDGLDSVKIFNEEQMKAIYMKIQMEMQKRQGAKMKVQSEKNIKAGEVFLAKNKTQPGIVTLPDGLQYKIIKEGAGVAPKPTDNVKVNYKGMLIDGTEFDSSIKRGQPTSFQLNQVIPGWTEGIQLIKPGGKIMLYIPSNLGYGERGPQVIPPGSTLIFEVELLEVTPGTDANAAKK